MSVTNHGEQCLQARKSMQRQTSHAAPRANPRHGAKQKHGTAASTHESRITLAQLMGDKSKCGNIADTLLPYTQRNVSFEVQKVIAITIVTTAIAKWGCSIVDAASHAADCCGFSTETVRQ